MEEQLSPEEVVVKKQEISQAAKNGRFSTVTGKLRNLSWKLVKEILDDENLEHRYSATPVSIAVINGRLRVLIDILAFLRVSRISNQEEADALHSRTKETALKTASMHNQMNIAKWLINSGCDVNQDSDGSGPPLMLACFHNSLAVAKYLMDNSADIEGSNDEGFTCLMGACLKGNEELARDLLGKGADIHRVSRYRTSALHLAAHANALAIVELLLQRGATMSKHKGGLYPLMEAAVSCSCDIVDLLLQSFVVTRKEKIDALELLGARLAKEDIGQAFTYLHRAMEERHKDSAKIITKPRSPLPTMSGVVESRTLEELVARQADHHTLRLECLAMERRISKGRRSCFSHDLEGYYYDDLNDYSTQLLQAGSRSEALALLLHVLKDSPKIKANTYAFCAVLDSIFLAFESMLERGESPEFSCVLCVLEVTIASVKQDNGSSIELLKKKTDKIICCLLCVVIGLKVAIGQEEGQLLMKQAKCLIGLSPPLPPGSSVLHMAVASYWSVIFARDLMEDLPFDLLVIFLLQCGANVQAMASGRRTLLHVVVELAEEGDGEMVSLITRTLIEAGVLVGVQDSQGKTALDLAGTEAVKAILRQHTPVSLKSLAATAVVKHQLPYAGEIPKVLEEFVQNH